MISLKFRSSLRALGLDVHRYTITSSNHARLKNFIHSMGTDLVLDVGANIGQTGDELRHSLGYDKTIHSFEPLSSAFAELKANVEIDPLWHAHNVALGSSAGKVEIHVANNSQSSSLLPMRKRHSDAAPESAIKGTEHIAVRTLDEVLPEIRQDAQNIFLKCDTQGFELEVLRGGQKSLPDIGLVLLEMSTEELYEGCPLLGDVIAYMYDHGFAMVDVKAGFADPETGQMLQCDGLFINLTLSPRTR